MSEILEVRVEKMVHGGEGLGRLPSGPVVFVSGALPGELVRARVYGKRKGVYHARVEEVLEPYLLQQGIKPVEAVRSTTVAAPTATSST